MATRAIPPNPAAKRLLGRGQNTRRALASMKDKKSMGTGSKEHAIEAKGINESPFTTAMSGIIAKDATPIAGAPSTGDINARILAMRPAMQLSANAGTARMFASGAIKETCENKAAENGRVTTLEASVRLTGSTTIMRTALRGLWNHEAIRPEKSTIPNVDPAERKIDTERQALGSVMRKMSTQSPMELNEAERRFAKNDRSPNTDMMALRMAEAGIPAKTT